jgi:hypothetical protein
MPRKAAALLTLLSFVLFSSACVATPAGLTVGLLIAFGDDM